MKTAEIKEITVDAGTTYDISQYKEGNGIYLVEEIGLVDKQIIYFNGTCAIFVASENDFPIIDIKEVEGKINESLLLKSLAILNGQKYSELQ